MSVMVLIGLTEPPVRSALSLPWLLLNRGKQTFLMRSKASSLLASSRSVRPGMRGPGLCSMLRFAWWLFLLRVAGVLIAVQLWPAASLAHGIHNHTAAVNSTASDIAKLVLLRHPTDAQSSAPVRTILTTTATRGWQDDVIACLGCCCGAAGATCCVSGILLEPAELPSLIVSRFAPVESRGGFWGFEPQRLRRPPKSPA